MLNSSVPLWLGLGQRFSQELETTDGHIKIDLGVGTALPVNQDADTFSGLESDEPGALLPPYTGRFIRDITKLK